MSNGEEKFIPNSTQIIILAKDVEAQCPDPHVRQLASLVAALALQLVDLEGEVDELEP